MTSIKGRRQTDADPMVVGFSGFARHLRSKRFLDEGNVKKLQKARTRRVEGIVTTQYTHIRFEAFQPSSPKVKKVVLKNAYDCISQMKYNGAK